MALAPGKTLCAASERASLRVHNFPRDGGWKGKAWRAAPTARPPSHQMCSFSNSSKLMVPLPSLSCSRIMACRQGQEGQQGGHQTASGLRTRNATVGAAGTPAACTPTYCRAAERGASALLGSACGSCALLKPYGASRQAALPDEASTRCGLACTVLRLNCRPPNASAFCSSCTSSVPLRSESMAEKYCTEQGGSRGVRRCNERWAVAVCCARRTALCRGPHVGGDKRSIRDQRCWDSMPAERPQAASG